MTLAKNKKMGFTAASGVAVQQGLEGVFFQFFFLVFSVAIIKNPAFGAASMAVKETIGVAISVIILGPTLFKNIFKRIREKQMLFYIAASIIGTSIGNVLYILAVSQAGSSYGVILTAMYPIFSMLIIRMSLKEKESWKVWTGLCITVASGILFLFLPSIFESDKGFSGPRFIGMILGLVTALFWSLEGVLLKAGLNTKLEKGQERFTHKEIVVTRSVFSGLSTYILIMPLMYIWGDSFNYLAKIFINWKAFLIVLSIAVNIVILRFLHIYALSHIGPKITATIDTNNFLIPTLFAEVLRFLNLMDTKNNAIFEPVIWWSYILLIPIAIGVCMVVYFSKDDHPDIVFEKHIE